MTTGLIVFARMGSSRFPGKTMVPIAGRALLGRVIDRARLVSGGHAIVVATSTEAKDDPIAAFAAEEGLDTFRGDLEDVSGRALACCEAHGFDRFARICGDRPFLPWELIDALLGRHGTEGLDLATNAIGKTYPSGTMTEIVSVVALRRSLEAGADAEDREHVTRFFYHHPHDFRIGSQVSGHDDWGRLSLAVDRPDDLERAEWILARLGDRPETARLDRVATLAGEYEATLHDSLDVDRLDGMPTVGD